MSTKEAPTPTETIAKLLEPFRGFMVARGTMSEPTEQLAKLAQAAYSAGAVDTLERKLADMGRVGACMSASREICAACGIEPMSRAHVEVYRLLGDIYSAAKQHPEGLQRDVRERAAALTESYWETTGARSAHATDVYALAPELARAFLLELFVNALLEARETAHVVDWSNPDQVELYTIAVEAESKRYEEINRAIAAAEKAERNPFDHHALQAIPNWFDELRPAQTSVNLHGEEGRDYIATNDPLFASALNRAFALGVQAASPPEEERRDEYASFTHLTSAETLAVAAAEWTCQAAEYAKANGHALLCLSAFAVRG